MVFLRGGRSLGTALQESGFREADRLEFVMLFLFYWGLIGPSPGIHKRNHLESR